MEKCTFHSIIHAPGAKYSLCKGCTGEIWGVFIAQLRLSQLCKSWLIIMMFILCSSNTTKVYPEERNVTPAGSTTAGLKMQQLT